MNEELIEELINLSNEFRTKLNELSKDVDELKLKVNTLEEQNKKLIMVNKTGIGGWML
jgi:uncharacterized coiled-coil DUF342 family protein